MYLAVTHCLLSPGKFLGWPGSLIIVNRTFISCPLMTWSSFSQGFLKGETEMMWSERNSPWRLLIFLVWHWLHHARLYLEQQFSFFFDLMAYWQGMNIVEACTIRVFFCFLFCLELTRHTRQPVWGFHPPVALLRCDSYRTPVDYSWNSSIPGTVVENC